ncbi:PAS domain-containing protein [Sediminibacterium soli]|uniref:PAS domain-containing protein n=1 Tax=Sediminibacterium soli TaxID=2698829 RepID=UPI00137B5971|nr:PAS domain-containing protein [Sediminibacterium soli]NCI46655.1 PAS domain-containing protein [Sediminibacterium soli]
MSEQQPKPNTAAADLFGNEQFRLLINHLPGAIYRCSGDEWLTLEFFSDEIENLTGYPVAYFLSDRRQGYLNIVHPEDRPALIRRMRDALAHKERFEFEYRIVRQDGTLRWVSERAQGIYEEGKQIRYVDGCIFDITHHRRIAEALEKSEGQIRLLSDHRNLSQVQQEELLQRLSLATDSASIGIWEIDLVTGQVIWDKRMFHMYGYPDGTDISLYQVFNNAVHPEDTPRMISIIQDLMSGLREINGAIYRIILPGGQIRYIDSHAIIKRSEAGKPLSLIGTNRDVTEDIVSHEKIKKQNTLLRDIAFRQSHQVRRPLANILAVLEVLRNSGSVGDLELFHHLEESAGELDQEIRSIVERTHSIDDEPFR